MLCFISNRLSNTPLDVLTKICCDFYSAREIETAKNLLLASCKDALEAAGSKRRPLRKGPNKAQSEIKDIEEIMHELGTGIPCFVAANLSRLPVVGMGAINLAALVSDITNIKTEMMQLKDAVLQQGRPVPSAPPLPDEDDTSAQTTETETAVSDAGHDESAPMGSDNSGNSGSTSTSDSSSPSKSFAAVTMDNLSDGFQTVRSRRRSAPCPGGGRPAITSNRPSALASAKKKPGIREAGVQGSGTNMNSLQAARPRASSRPVAPGSGLFVTQLKPGTHYAAVKDHIFVKTGLRLKCITLRSRNDHLYASFRVLCNETELKRLMSPSLWPKGVYLKKFEER